MTNPEAIRQNEFLEKRDEISHQVREYIITNDLEAVKQAVEKGELDFFSPRPILGSKDSILQIVLNHGRSEILDFILENANKKGKLFYALFSRWDRNQNTLTHSAIFGPSEVCLEVIKKFIKVSLKEESSYNAFMNFMSGPNSTSFDELTEDSVLAGRLSLFSFFLEQLKTDDKQKKKEILHKSLQQALTRFDIEDSSRPGQIQIASWILTQMENDELEALLQDFPYRQNIMSEMMRKSVAQVVLERFEPQVILMLIAFVKKEERAGFIMMLLTFLPKNPSRNQLNMLESIVKHSISREDLKNCYLDPNWRITIINFLNREDFLTQNSFIHDYIKSVIKIEKLEQPKVEA